MGEGCGSWFPQPQFDWRSSYFNSLTAPVSLGHHTTIPDMIIPGAKMVSAAAGILPVRMDTEPPHLQTDQVNEPHGWFHRLPRFQQANLPASNPIFKEQLLSDGYINHREATAPKADFGGAQKRFIVFDQSGEQTTLFLSPDFGSPNLSAKPLGVYNSKEEGPIPKGDLSLHLGPISANAFDGNGTDSQSEMHEDTEELNALLYSDDDDDDSDYTEEDDVTSTGHSPSTITAHNRQYEGFNEEVASSGGTTRKRKLFDGGDDSAAFLMDTASSMKPKSSSEYDDDAESSCANGKIARIDDLSSYSGNKRMRKDKIRETLSLLRSIIPEGDGKDAIVVLDEAIGYLKSLRLKVKDSSC